MKQGESLIARNLAWFIKRHATNPHALAEAIAASTIWRDVRPVTQATLFRILSGQSKDPRTSTLQPLADYFGVSVSALREYDFQSSGLDNYGNSVPLSTAAPAGGSYPLLAWEQTGNGEEVATPQRARAHFPVDLGPHGFCLRVKGASMIAEPGVWPSFPEGIILYVNPDLSASTGHFVIVQRPGQRDALFRRLAEGDGGNRYLEALNPAWPERYVPLTPADRLRGVVVHADMMLV
ncbi:hypothetical protein PATSB16_14190 [Pandoraea thiooxydans]|uniref:HTH cro/C1-type domain-containing protein n=1 Tax=Pandoraea thiooxydans TaxID=445709 RepID=A0A0U4ECQ8_9BURK|nr:S24 family peptidase [Pandoraea thiooxydans]ALX34868.1 hypothetical protein ABW99_20880 [Pandoraea thiooxydans]APR94761.1 hypothetical protein PATSB16_14190 [Pandoraea thiooxydans]